MRRLKPIATYDCNQSIADANRLLDHLDKVQAGPDSVHIHEDLALTEVACKPVVETSSVGSTILSAVTDEDFWHNPPSFGNDYWDCLCKGDCTQRLGVWQERGGGKRFS